MNTESSNSAGSEANETVQIDIRALSAEQLAMLGVSQIAYVKPVFVNGTHGFAIHAADGTPMAMAGDREIAVAAILQHEMHAVSVH